VSSGRERSVTRIVHSSPSAAATLQALFVLQAERLEDGRVRRAA
jgi:hypothetical protein